MKIIRRMAPTMRISLVPLFQLCSPFVILSRGHKWSAFLIDFVNCLIVHFSFFSFSVLTNIKLTWHKASFNKGKIKARTAPYSQEIVKNTFPEPQFKAKVQLQAMTTAHITCKKHNSGEHSHGPVRGWTTKPKKYLLVGLIWKRYNEPIHEIK